MFENSLENILEQQNPIVEQNSHLFVAKKKIPPKFQITASHTCVSFSMKKITSIFKLLRLIPIATEHSTLLTST